MNKLLMGVVLFLGLVACGGSSEPTEPVGEAQQAITGCSAHKTYDSCNADLACMWSGVSCIKRVE